MLETDVFDTQLKPEVGLHKEVMSCWRLMCMTGLVLEAASFLFALRNSMRFSSTTSLFSFLIRTSATSAESGMTLRCSSPYGCACPSCQDGVVLGQAAPCNWW